MRRVRLLIGFTACWLLLCLSACGYSDPYNSGDPVVIVHHHTIVHHTVIRRTVTHHVTVRRSLSLRKR